MTTRRRRGEDGISFEHRGPCRDPRPPALPGLWRGEITLGYTASATAEGQRPDHAVVDKLRDLPPLAGITQGRLCHYTVRQAAEDWLATGLEGRSPKTVTKTHTSWSRSLPSSAPASCATCPRRRPAGPARGGRVLHRRGLDGAPGALPRHPAPPSRQLSAATFRPSRHAQRPARPPSKSLTLDQAVAVITAARTLPVLELRPG